MKIKSIEIVNYKEFYGKYKINVSGKNLFIYGENGSGKSSLYYALKDFFQSSMETIDLNEVENIFIKKSKKGNCQIKVTFNAKTPGTTKRTKQFQLSTASKDTDSGTDTRISDANSLKSFITYKHLLDIHHIKKGSQIDLFNFLVLGALKHFKFSLTSGKELGKMWDDIINLTKKATSRTYNITRKKKDVKSALKAFNEAFVELFKEGSPESILKHAKPILEQFNHNLEIKLRYRQAKPSDDYLAIENNQVHLELFFAGKKIKKPHLFLNEARLSAIAISIYLGMIKRHIQLIECKILFLDDVFIGLDIANRLPLLNILKSEFSDYQIFITTYDKPWFEYAKGFLDNKKWLTQEFYAIETKDGYEIPKIFDNQDLLAKARWHYNNSDYKAAAVYARSAFEKIIRKYCEKKKKKVIFKQRLKDYTTESFWTEVKEDIPSTIKLDIEKYRALVLNSFSHYNTEKHEIKPELKSAIDAIEALGKEL
jgi:energy-coupling factor transporter ATP-binding protein EcfA2